MKLLFVVSSLDLTQPFSATPAWWQLMKGLYEVGVEVIATPYQGPAIESLWWRAVENPAKWQGDAFKTVRDTVRKLRPETPAQQVQMTDTAADDYQQESASDKLIRQTAQTLIAPLWLRHLDNLLTKEPDIDAVVFVTIPLNQLNGVPEEIIRKHNKPVFYYDGDVPASLPNMKGFATGFRIYNGSKPQEYTAFISNSTGGEDLLRQLGAKATHTLWYGADPDVFAPTDVAEQDLDVMFYGHGREYRGEWVDAMIRDASNALPDARFAVRGTRLGDLGRAQSLPYLSFSKLREYACRSKINLCITRGAHASVYGSSSSRPFELSAMQCCIVANPYNGLDQWFEPEKEIIIVKSGEEALDRYRFLLSHDEERQRMALAARERILKEHTFRHRARDLVKIVQMYL
ncbi:MAG: glycosyltransferase [Anaerolineae bacterium]|nr:glycosyltransferase [Anaerolineae bacterium]